MDRSREGLPERAQRLLSHLPPLEDVTPQEWRAAKTTVRHELWELAAVGKGCHHGDLAGAVSMPPRNRRWFRLLDEACLEVVATEGPLVTALVTAKDSSVPGEGFFTLAERLCLDWDDPRAFAESEQAQSTEWIKQYPEGWDLAS